MDVKVWRRVEEILDAALACERTEWDRVLDERCGDDKALRAEVEALLACVDARPGVLETPPAAMAAALVAEAEGNETEGRQLARAILARLTQHRT